MMWADTALSDRCWVSYFVFKDLFIGILSDPNETHTVISALLEEGVLGRSTSLPQTQMVITFILRNECYHHYLFNHHSMFATSS